MGALCDCLFDTEKRKWNEKNKVFRLRMGNGQSMLRDHILKLTSVEDRGEVGRLKITAFGVKKYSFYIP